MTLTAADIARHLEGQVEGDPSTLLTGFAPATAARPGDLTFAENEAYLTRAASSEASAILVAGTAQAPGKVLIRVKNARVAFARVLPLFFPEPKPAPGIHPTAIVSPSARIDPTAHLGPGCVIGDDAVIGARCQIEAGAVVGAACQLGDDSRLCPKVTLYPRCRIGQRVTIHAGSVIGADGYGYVLDGGAHRKVPQVGNVIIHDDVEIGANVTIDRGALGSTVIGKGTKIDNLVQIGHNVVIGEHCLLVAQVGVAGSARLGNYVTLGGQVGIAGHLKVGDRAMIAAQSGLMNDVPAGEKWMGSPARPDRQMKRQFIASERLPDLLRRVAELERRLAELTPPPPAA